MDRAEEGQEGQKGREEKEKGDGRAPAVRETGPAVPKAPSSFREPFGLDLKVPGSLAGGGATGSSELIVVDYIDLPNKILR